MNSILTLCLGILIGLFIGVITGTVGAIAGLRVLHLMRMKKIQEKKKAEVNIAYRDINFLNAKFKDVV
ncbi:hypothetical protein [Acetivibrio straminisolvens]|jgi:hypothetical protein|uniref:Uncharacterized protein n=1 Tax=Acetivibrio straminisolvens JCM 21531 TaxID=1294263 RepID=W4V6U1_9FIRM|nr:hypothetical protein [Acetivibrio straminisolvens]GAE88901.1 hypothetical protein JCM21531_2383 [Acetivibrio straminisolvens JCM 21531]